MSSVDIYVDLGVTPVINAAGTFTRLSGSVMLPEVAEAMAGAARDFVDMHELHLAAGRRIAHLVGVGICWPMPKGSCRETSTPSRMARADRT